MSESLIYDLYRPYLDLGPAAEESPYHSIGLSWALDSALREVDRGFIQASVNASFRDELTIGNLARFSGDQLSTLNMEEQNEDWSLLSRLTACAQDLNLAQFLKLAWAISRLGFHRDAAALIDSASPSGSSEEVHHVRYLRAWCDFRSWLDDPAHPYNRSDFAKVATSGPLGVARLDASYQMMMQAAKFDRDLASTLEWQHVHSEILQGLKADMDRAEWERYQSRYHRVTGFVPQLQGDRAGVIAEMSAAEEIARSLQRRTYEESILADEMLYPCIESRMQEALWLGDLETALERSVEYLNMRRYDPKGWLHHGDVLVNMERFDKAADAYLQASLFAPPGKSIALFLRGQCQEQLGDDLGAFASYWESVEHDPLAISSITSLTEVSQRIGHTAVHSWAEARMRELVANPPNNAN